MNDSRLRRANALTLQWHAGASTIGFEAFQAWALALLKPALRFDGAVWGVVGATGGVGVNDDRKGATPPRINGAHLHRVPQAALDQLEHVRLDDFSDKRPPARALTICLADLAWAQPEHAALREHARQYGMTNALSICFVDGNPAGRQFVLLTRKALAHRFSPDETERFELLAPHMMQAFATCRKLFLESRQVGGRQSSGHAVAMIDRAGVVHDPHVRFVPMLRREWSDWPGKRLPEPLLELTARRAGTRWRFVGEQVAADFEPVDDLYLVTVRPRQSVDALTPREGEVAQRYAAGGNFREIAETLELAPATVRSHLRNVFAKLKIRNKSQLAAALRQR